MKVKELNTPNIEFDVRTKKERFYQTEWFFQIMMILLIIVFFIIFPIGIIIGMSKLSEWLALRRFWDFLLGIFTVVIIIIYYVILGFLIGE